MWALDCEESWAPKNLCFWTMVLEKTLESPPDCKEIQPVHPTGDQSWMFIRRTDAEAETPILWPPHAKSWLIGKDPDAGRNWGQEEKGMTEDEMAGRHQRLDARVWVNSGSWWWTGRPGVLQFMGSQRVWHDWATELNWTELIDDSWLILSWVTLTFYLKIITNSRKLQEKVLGSPMHTCILRNIETVLEFFTKKLINIKSRQYIFKFILSIYTYLICSRWF